MAKKKVEKKLKIELNISDIQTRKGLPGLRVEAWDKDQKYDDFLGVGTTDTSGKATIDFSEGSWREYAPDLPDLYFKVYHGKTLLRSTEDSVIMNVEKSRTETIEVELPAPLPPGRDLVSARQVFKARDWVRQSDFRSVGLESLERLGTRLRLVKDAVANTARNMDLKPVTPGRLSHLNIVGRDTKMTKEDLEANDISVNVKAYDPKLNKAALTELTALPSRLKRGQTVNLYEKNGEVRYYSIVTGESPASRELRKELDGVKVELQATRKMSDEKDRTISALQQEIKILRESHEQMKDVISSKRMTKIEKDLEGLKEFRAKIEKPQAKTGKTKRK